MIKFEATLPMKGIASMDELSLFTLALGISKPWQVVDLKFSKEEGRLDLWLEFTKGAKFPCPSCPETKEADVHDTQDRTWGPPGSGQSHRLLEALVQLRNAQPPRSHHPSGPDDQALLARDHHLPEDSSDERDCGRLELED